MAFHVRDPETDALVREVAAERRMGITQTIKAVFDEERRRRGDTAAERRRRTEALIERWDKIPKTGPAPDKAFFDSLYED